MSILRQTLAILAKELRMEWRTREIVYTMVFFGVVIAVVFSFGFFERAVAARATPGVLWTAVLFAGTVSVSRTFEREQEGNCIAALMLIPGTATSLFLGKVLANLFFLILMQVVVSPLIMLMLQLDALPNAGGVVAVLLLGSVGYAALGTLVGSMLSQVRMRGVLLPLVLYPLLIPIFGIGVTATAMLLDNRPEAWGYLPVLGALDFLLILVSWWLFGRLLENTG